MIEAEVVEDSLKEYHKISRKKESRRYSPCLHGGRKELQLTSYLNYIKVEETVFLFF